MARTKGKRPYRGAKGSRSKSEAKEDFKAAAQKNSRPYDNDLSWYAHNPTLLADAANFPYPNRPGMQLAYTSESNAYKYVLPGILSLEWMPSIGVSASPSDPASILGNEIYSRVRNAFSGDLKADGPDYVMYILALDSIFAYIANLKRIYRIMTAWTPDNRHLPENVLNALDVEAPTLDNLRKDRVQFHQYINQLVLMTRKFVCPGDFDYINRHYWMNDNVYTDRASINSQFYVFRQIGYLQFAMLPNTDGVDAPGVKMVKDPLWGATSPNNLTAFQLYKFGEDLINSLSTWDEVYTINGYLQRAYEGSPTFVVDELPFDSVLVPVYSEEVLSQIENATCVPLNVNSTTDFSGLNITQNTKTNSVVAAPRFVYTQPSGASPLSSYRFFENLKPYINLRSDNPTAAMNVEATRLKCQVAVNVSPAGEGYTITANISSCASEIVTGYVLSGTRSYNGQLANTVHYLTSVLQFKPNDTWDIRQYMWAYGLLSSFDWHPITTYLYTDNSGIPVNAILNGDVANITYIDRNALENLHTVCLYSLLNSFNS